MSLSCNMTLEKSTHVTSVTIEQCVRVIKCVKLVATSLLSLMHFLVAEVFRTSLQDS